MSTHDISRSVFDPAKRYSGVWMQQGRVLVDDDWNESQRIDSDALRRATADIIGPQGSPDNGLRITAPIVDNGEIDFEIGAGVFYLGGLRVRVETPETYRLQRDWLQRSAEEPVDAPSAERFDLVFVEAWEQPVGAVEDSELFEVALGGADTAGRLRTIRRVRLEPDVGPGDCAAAWEVAKTRWLDDRQGILNAAGDVHVDTQLLVGVASNGSPENLCAPTVLGGYLGAENQAIRVQIVDPDHFTWGFDNASPLYRIEILNPTTVRLLTAPKDEAHWPRAGEIVEILPWAAALPNGEKVASIVGQLLTVSNYDSVTREVTFLESLPVGYGMAWSTRSDADQLDDPSRGAPLDPGIYQYMRVWDRGAVDPASPDARPSIPFPSAWPIRLGQTGLQITLAGDQRLAGDHWIIAARPETPTNVVPWQLEVASGRPPHGIQRFRAPLAVIHWRQDDVAEVHDCRWHFRPLTRIETCCTVRVGDGVHSHGDFTSIQTAIDSLPATGGEVCVLPGEYQESFTVEGRQHITLRGCGRQTILRPSSGAGAVITIRDSSAIAIRSLIVEAEAGLGVHAEQTAYADVEGRRLSHVTLAGVVLRARERAALVVRGGCFITLMDSMVEIASLVTPLQPGSDAGQDPAVFIMADDVRIELNRIVTDRSRGASMTALGGVQIGGGSERVELRRNLIEGGNGNGITLGSVAYVPEERLDRFWATFGERSWSVASHWVAKWLRIDPDGCIHFDDDPDPPGGDQTLVPISEGNLRWIGIYDNTITLAGGDGIGVARFFDVGARPQIIGVEDMSIERNRIQGNARLSREPPSNTLRYQQGHGGIALAHGRFVRIWDNLILDNGTTLTSPVCGVFVLHAEGIAIERNHISGNGPATRGEALPPLGHRGGIVVAGALTFSRDVGERTREPAGPNIGEHEPASHRWVRQSDNELPWAVRVIGNVIVSPLGMALKVVATGSTSVHGNHLVAREPVWRFRSLQELLKILVPVLQEQGPDALLDLLANTALVINLGRAHDYFGLGGATGLRADPAMTSYEKVPEGEAERPLAGFAFPDGATLFNDNQIELEPPLAAASLLLTSVLVASLDDALVNGNQFLCKLGHSTKALLKYLAGDLEMGQLDAALAVDPEGSLLLADLVVVALSARVAENRLQESLGRAVRSAVTWALMNTTTANQGTHCITVYNPGHPPYLVVDAFNTSLIQVFGFCGGSTHLTRPEPGHLAYVPPQ